MTRSLLAACACLALAACATAPMPDRPASPDPVAGDALRTTLTGEGAWRLTHATDARGRRIDVLFGKGVDVRLQFVDDHVGVLGVCNRMGGAYAISGGKLRIGPLMSTRMACDEPLMQAEAAIGRLLQQPAAVQLRERQPPQLMLQPANGETLLFDPLPLE